MFSTEKWTMNVRIFADLERSEWGTGNEVNGGRKTYAGKLGSE